MGIFDPYILSKRTPLGESHLPRPEAVNDTVTSKAKFWLEKLGGKFLTSKPHGDARAKFPSF